VPDNVGDEVGDGVVVEVVAHADTATTAATSAGQRRRATGVERFMAAADPTVAVRRVDTL
jgi:hypothetical protein